MNFNNPTPIQLGMSGTFTGKVYRVVGRVVLGEEEAGSIYYWNEYNLQNDTGESATLVYEVTERGPEWRWFELFEPQFPLSPEEAADKRVGDPVNLDGTELRVMFRQTSHIYHVEGIAPEGEQVGSVARYFNAESGDVMQVVSWTGRELEFYRGLTVAAAMVAVAFDLPVDQFKPVFRIRNGTPGLGRVVIAAVGGIFAVVCFVAVYSSCVAPRRLPAVAYYTLPAPALKVGTVGTLNGVSYRIVGRSFEEVAQVGRHFEQYVFYLKNRDGSDALLLYAWNPVARNWALFTPLHPQVPVTPEKAAAVRWKETINVEGVSVAVSDLFRCTIRKTEGAAQGLSSYDTLYGFSGQDAATLLLARWNEQGVQFYRGEFVTSRTAAAAFAEAEVSSP